MDVKQKHQMSTTMMPTASWYWHCQGKHNTVKHWMEQCFTDIDKEEKDQLQ